jgi:hypothetical protein
MHFHEEVITHYSTFQVLYLCFLSTSCDLQEKQWMVLDATGSLPTSSCLPLLSLRPYTKRFAWFPSPSYLAFLLSAEKASSSLPRVALPQSLFFIVAIFYSPVHTLSLSNVPSLIYISLTFYKFFFVCFYTRLFSIKTNKNSFLLISWLYCLLLFWIL